MIKAIKTFFGNFRGGQGDRKVVIQQGRMWRCTKCSLLFLTEEEGGKHFCTEANTK